MTPRQRPDIHRALAALLAAGMLHAPTSAAGESLRFERVLQTPCRALALDREPYVAALTDDAVIVTDQRGTHQEKLPDALRGPGLDVGVFFGRDYRVRVAGSARTPRGDEVRYYRSLPGGLKPALDELGPLGQRGAPGLIALLGTADPEIVCRVGQSCLIKSVHGWAKAPAPSGLERVGLSLGTGWAIAGNALYTLGKKAWSRVGAEAPWRKADDAFVRGSSACVVERDASRLHHFDGAAWHSSAAPLSGPRSVWGNEEALWVAGDGGAASWQGESFRQVDGVAHVAQVLGRSARDVWLCSSDGVYRSRAP